MVFITYSISIYINEEDIKAFDLPYFLASEVYTYSLLSEPNTDIKISGKIRKTNKGKTYINILIKFEAISEDWIKFLNYKIRWSIRREIIKYINAHNIKKSGVFVMKY